ncbi:SPX domain-containing protein [Cryptosporidium andersoni]|uniref:SPX domain-containing protein n=1 Tax=Cryptosporidium andersoni TaxID=117008 RepID=A0A1J4MR54_9CRYT|nr:SPX domain-containing protein [Cryptosporidium andersoni]
MKFSKRLQHYVNQQYAHHYLAYKDLKRAIKLITGSDTSSYTIKEVTSNFGNIRALAGSVYRPAESRFMDLLNHELDKINSFSNIIYNSIKDSLKQVLIYFTKLQKDDLSSVSSAGDSEQYRIDSGIEVNKYFNKSKLLEDSIRSLIAQLEKANEDIIFLDSYQQLNYTGFRKITKKYDKINKSSSSAWYMARLAKEPFMNLNVDALLQDLSKCYVYLNELKTKNFNFPDNFVSRSSTSSITSQLLQESLESSIINSNSTASVVGSYEFHAKHLIQAEDIMKVKVLAIKKVPLFSIGLLKVDDDSISQISSPASKASHFTSSIALQTTTVSFVYFDNDEFEEYNSLRNSLKQNTSISGESNINKDYIPPLIGPETLRGFKENIFRLRWFGENDGNPDQWLYLDWVHPTEPCCGSVEWCDPELVCNIREGSIDKSNFKVPIQSYCSPRTFKFEQDANPFCCATVSMQQKDIYHILSSCSLIEKESRNPILAIPFDVEFYIEQNSNRLTELQKYMIKSFVNTVEVKKLRPSCHLWFHRTTLASSDKTICIHIDTNWKLIPEMKNKICPENPDCLSVTGSYISETIQSPSARDITKIRNSELGISTIADTRLSILYNTYIVSPPTEALVSENMKMVPFGIMGVSICLNSGSFKYHPRDFLREVVGLASVSEVVGFTNFETCTALLYAHLINDLPHWFRFMAIETGGQLLSTPKREVGTKVCLSLDGSNLQINEKLNTISNTKLQKFPKVDVLHTGASARLIHDQEAIAQREALALTSELQLYSTPRHSQDTIGISVAPTLNKHLIQGQEQLSESLLGSRRWEVSQITVPEQRISLHRFIRNIKNSVNTLVGYISVCLYRNNRPREINNSEDQVSKKSAISTTVRVEPKTFFANERTLLQWMNMSVLLGTMAVSLLTFGTPISHTCGIILAPVAIFFIGYSYHVFIVRSAALEKKEPINYNDRLGPTLLVLSLVISLSIILFLNIAIDTNGPVSHKAMESPSIEIKHHLEPYQLSI